MERVEILSEIETVLARCLELCPADTRLERFIGEALLEAKLLHKLETLKTREAGE